MRASIIGEGARRQSLLLSVAGGIALFLLAVSVFAVASQAQSLSAEAEYTVQTVENLRVVSMARAELSVASRLDEVAPDEDLAIEGALANAMNALDSVEGNLDSSTPANIQSAFVDFRAAADAQAAQIAGTDVDIDSMQAAELRTGQTFDALAEAMRAEQLDGIEGLEADNDLLNVIATIATFMVAFVVPSVGLVIFQMLRKAPRELRQLQFDYDRLELRSSAMASTISTEASELRSEIADSSAQVDPERLASSLLRFENISALNGAATSIRVERLNVNSVIASTIAQMSPAVTIGFTKGSEWFATADQNQFERILNELATNAAAHGATPIHVEVAASGEFVEVHVVDAGNGLAGDVSGVVLDELEFELREDASTGTFGFGLLTARRSLEAMGGSLRYERKLEQTHLIAAFPLSLSESDDDIEELPLAA